MTAASPASTGASIAPWLIVSGVSLLAAGSLLATGAWLSRRNTPSGRRD